MNSNKTDQLIQSLATQALPVPKAPKFVGFVLRFFSMGFFSGALIYALVLLRQDPLAHLNLTAMDRIEMVAWVIMALAALALTWDFGHPAKKTRLAPILKFLPVIVLGLVLFRLAIEGWNSVDTEFTTGGCGPLLMLQSLGLSFWLSYDVRRRLAPVNLLLSSLWIAIASVGFSGFAMQWLCVHHSAAHVALWHLVPCFASTVMWSALAQERIRW